MKKLAVLATLALASSAFAAETKIDLKGRFDYQNTKTKTNNGTTTVEDSTGEYQTSYLRLATSSKLNDTVSAKLTLDLTDSNDTTKKNELTKFVDEAYLTKSFGMGLSAMVGKQGVLVGGRENDWSSRDAYSSSAFNGSLPGAVTGLTVGYEVAGQNIYVQHLESDSTTALTDKKITGVAYYGNFMDGMIAPIVSYHKVGTDRAGQYDLFTAAGVQFKWNMIVAEFDYLMLTQENGGTTTTGAKADAELKTMYAHVRYNHDNFRPFFKFMKDEGEKGFSFSNVTVGNGIEAEKTTMEVGLEYVPNKDEDFRYHVVYASSETKETTGTVKEKYEEDKIFAGVAFAWNLLK